MRPSCPDRLVGWVVSITGAVLAATSGLPSAQAADSSAPVQPLDLNNMSLEQLADIDITSVSKSPEPLSDAAAAIYVITHDAIMRSGATSIPEILRLAPNLQVAQTSASSYAITARGFNGGFADKLLVLIDGRSVYSSQFGGVFWDVQDVPPEDIERIEVISGPGATLWGANAVNGVINIITKKSEDSQGGMFTLGAGNLEERASLQYGGKLGPDLAYRVYGEGFYVRHSTTPTDSNSNDGWSKPQGGFRLDWTPENDSVTVEGNLYRGEDQTSPTLDQALSGGNFQVNWQHQLHNGSSLQLQAYYDESRFFAHDGSGFSLNTYDIELQHSFSWLSWNHVVWGIGYRGYQNQFANATSILYLPNKSTTKLTDIFGQDTISLSRKLKLILGLKLENDPYSGVTPLPNIRLSWQPNEKLMFWSAASRAVRAPTPFDTELNEKVGNVVFLAGNSQFQPEKLTAYEAGTRIQATPDVSFSVSSFYNIYRDLRSIEISPVTLLPLRWGNKMEGDVYGVEVWGDYRVTDWWRLTAGFNLQHEALRFEPGAGALLLGAIPGIALAGNDPHHQASLRSSVNLGPKVTWDADLRYVGPLPSPPVPSYVELNTSVTWTISKSLEVSLSGFNLIHPHHQEFQELFPAIIGNEVGRSFYAETRWRF